MGDFNDRADFSDADRGLIGSLEPGVVHGPNGGVVWDNDAYGFLQGDCPETANPSLWRQSQLTAKQGLYEVTDGIYQVRGLDLSNMTLVESDNGIIVIDPLLSTETAAAALALYRKHRGDRAVTAIIYTHAHADHFGGVHGVYESEVPIYAGQSYTGIEIAELMEMPPALEQAWHTHGYYGSVSHNVKAIYQRYLGWFDGNPAHIWGHPPVENATRYVECMGGADAAVSKAQGYADQGDLRFAAELLNHAVFADETNATAKNLLAGVYEQLGYGCENGTWRNFYLQGAYELRNGVVEMTMNVGGSPELVGALGVDQLIDSIAIRVNGPRAWDLAFTIDWVFTDLGHTYRMELTNGVLIQDLDPAGAPDLSLTLTKTQFLGALGGRGLDGIATTGDLSVLQQLQSILDRPNPNFPIVTP